MKIQDNFCVLYGCKKLLSELLRDAACGRRAGETAFQHLWGLQTYCLNQRDGVILQLLVALTNNVGNPLEA